METKETSKDMKRIKNRIILNNLTEKQKEVLIKTGLLGGALTSGLFILYSMKEPETIPGLYTDTTADRHLTESSEGESNNSVEIVSLKPVTEISEQNISFGEAFKVARELCGPGGWFVWKGNIYNTYYKEEWNALSQEEKKDYLASIEIKNTKTHDNQLISDNLNDNLNAEIIASNNDEKEEIELERNVQDNNITIDLKTYNELKYNTEETPSTENDGIITGEIITLDEDSEIIENGFFELPDDIEITAISEEESKLIDQLTLDSSELTSFPWETSEVLAENEISENNFETESIDELNITEEKITGKTPAENEEYPWGESIINPNINKADSVILEEINPEETINIISNPEEIKEYPWGELVENSDQNAEKNNSDSIINELNEGITKNQSQIFSDIEEFPWGEKNENFNPLIDEQISIDENKPIEIEVENIGIILPDETENVSTGKLPSSFDEITEFPWGETVPHSPVDPYTSPDNDIFDNPTNQHRTFTGDNE